MTFYVDNDTEYEFPFVMKDAVEAVAKKVLEAEGCPFTVELNVLLTDNENIRKYNNEYRGINKETDVLSFPNITYETPADFTGLEDKWADCFEPDTGELILGDIIISYEKVEEQAKFYGHSVLREFSFLVAHSMLHLLGYDHMVQEEADIMEMKQETILKELGITRE